MPRLLFVGRLIRTKGIIEAIESVAIARATCHITFDIVGAGDLEQECERTIEARRLGDIVKLHGRQSKEEVFHWYDRSHVFLFPSYREPSGNVVFEAMSWGMPVITSRVGGPAYVVNDDSGYRISPESRTHFIAKLAAAISAFTTLPKKLNQMSNAALCRSTNIATWPKKIDLLMKLYAELDASSRKGASAKLIL